MISWSKIRQRLGITYHNHRNKCSNHEAHVNCQVGEPNEPSVASTGLELTGAFGATDRSSRIFTTDTDTKKEAVSSESRKHAVDATMGTV